MKKQYHLLHSLITIEKQYDTYIIDIAGVLYDGEKKFSCAINTINYLLAAQKQIIFLSNNPRTNIQLSQKLNTFEIVGNYHIVTSGDLLHYIINTELKNKTVYHLGRNRQHSLLEGINIKLTHSLDYADAIILSCFVEGDEDRTMFDADLYQILLSKKPVYCPNPDQLALQGSILRYPSGYFANELIKIGGSVIYLGKPYQFIYEFITHIHPDIYFDKSRTLMIGDTLETDICGAINFGIDSLLVLSGITGLKTKQDSDILNKSIYQPTYVMKRLC